MKAKGKLNSVETKLYSIYKCQSYYKKMLRLTGQTDSFSTVANIQQNFHLKHNLDITVTLLCTNELEQQQQKNMYKQ